MGRTGYMDFGFSPSGCLDGFSSRLANFLVANSAREAVLEMTLCGASMRFDTEAVIAFTGANMEPLLNGKPMPMNRAVFVEAGDILYTAFAREGMRSYLAVAGGFDIAPVLGSRSTNLRARIGGFKGRKLESKDVIPFRIKAARLTDLKARVCDVKKYGFITGVYGKDAPLALRVVEGAQSSYFTQRGSETFYSAVYTVRADSDRMGIRLEGPAVESKSGADIVSDGIALGAIQIPNAGTPIVLLHDRQTTGGYAKIGAVLMQDVWRLSQAMTGSSVRFERVTMPQAQKLYRAMEKEIERLRLKFIDKDKQWTMHHCCLVM
jgi:biotin-dependent carboxylase-like uncharacterized protein